MRATFFTIPFAFAAAALTFGVSAGPAVAATNDAQICATAPDALRTLAQSATPSAAKTAMRNINTGVALCEERNRDEAVKKFNAAAKALGTDLATAMAKGPVTAAVQ
jgi:hypothetical protein